MNFWNFEEKNQEFYIQVNVLVTNAGCSTQYAGTLRDRWLKVLFSEAKFIPLRPKYKSPQKKTDFSAEEGTSFVQLSAFSQG